MSEQLVIAAIDVGSADTKWAVLDSGGKVRSGSFVSIAPLAQKSGVGRCSATSRVAVDGGSYFVGFGCLNYPHARGFLNQRLPAWAPRLDLDALITYALAAIDVPAVNHLVLSQSPECPQVDCREYAGIWVVPVLATRGAGTRAVAVKAVSVASPATAAFIFAAERAAGLREEPSQTLLLQLGYSSLVFRAPAARASRTGTLRLGMLDIYKRLSVKLCGEHGLKKIPHVRLELAHVGARDLQLRGHQVNFSSELPRALPLLDEAVDEVLSRTGRLPHLRNLVVTGGCAHLLAARISETRPYLPRPVVPPRPQFAAVQGLLKIGLERAGAHDLFA